MRIGDMNLQSCNECGAVYDINNLVFDEYIGMFSCYVDCPACGSNKEFENSADD